MPIETTKIDSEEERGGQMHFQIKRASLYETEVMPCDDAVQSEENNWYIELLTIEDLALFVVDQGSPVTIIQKENRSFLLTIQDLG